MKSHTQITNLLWNLVLEKIFFQKTVLFPLSLQSLFFIYLKDRTTEGDKKEIKRERENKTIGSDLNVQTHAPTCYKR